MGVCFNENGTSKCTSGANYIFISVEIDLDCEQSSYFPQILRASGNK